MGGVASGEPVAASVLVSRAEGRIAQQTPAPLGGVGDHSGGAAEGHHAAAVVAGRDERDRQQVRRQAKQGMVGCY